MPSAKLNGLELLLLDNSTIADVAPLASLTSLKRLYLEGCELDYSPLADIYPNLEDKDFVIIPKTSTLAEFGFVMDGDGNHAVYDSESVSIRINHIEWGEGPDGQSVTFFDSDVGGYHLIIHYFADEGRYQFSLHMNENECAFDIYPDRDEYGWEYPDSETVRNMLSAAISTQEKEIYTESLVHRVKFLQERFGMGIDEICALPEQ